MKICHLVPGSGGTFYCQNCLRDYSLARALRKTGADASMIPLYLPPFDDEAAAIKSEPVFFGGIGVYLRHHLSWLQSAPGWVNRALDAPWLLKMAAKREGSTSAAKLGPMTVSMLEGRRGCHRKEFERLVEWIVTEEKPDIIHISNALLLGIAAEIARDYAAPIVCSLQDEEPWVEAMGMPYNGICWKFMANHAKHIARFIATSSWYADRMSSRLNVPRNEIDVVFPGIELDGISEAPMACDPPTIGFLSRINESQGFGQLVDAFVDLKKEPEFSNLRLRASGGCTAGDQPFLDLLMGRLEKHAFHDALEIVPRFARQDRFAFLCSLSVLSTPVPQGEAFGLQLLEAMACGVPVVQPRIGAYPEIIEATGGGILYEPGEPGALADALRCMLAGPDYARSIGETGRAAVRKHFGIDSAAQAMLQLYRDVLSHE